MNIKKLFTVACASALALSAMAVTASAASVNWTATGTTTVTEADGVYTVTQPSGGAAVAASADLLAVMENAPADLTTADGTITVSYDLYRPSDKKGASDWFIDLSTNTTVKGWSGGNAGTFGRLSGYGPWGNNFKLVPGTGATNGTVYQFNTAKDDEWTTVVFTVDLKATSVKAAMGEESSEAYTAAYPTGIENALYLNVVPSGTAPSNDAALQFKNITAAYATPDPNAATPEPTAEPEPPVIPEGVDYYQFPGNKAVMTNGNQCNNNDTFTFIGGVDEVAEAVFADPLNAAVVDDELVANYMNWIGGTYGSNPTFTATIPAGSYKLYVLGYNSGTNPPTATIGENVYQAGAGVNFATGGGKTLKLYTMELNLTEDITDASVVLNTADQFLPDLYAVVIAGTKATEAPKTLPTVEVSEFGTYTSDSGNPAKAYTGTFTVDAEQNVAVSGVTWTVGTASATSTFDTVISSGTVVTGLVVTAADLAAIPAPAAVAVAAE